MRLIRFRPYLKRVRASPKKYQNIGGGPMLIERLNIHYFLDFVHVIQHMYVYQKLKINIYSYHFVVVFFIIRSRIPI